MKWIMDYDICSMDMVSYLLWCWTRTDKSKMRLDHGFSYKTIIFHIIVCYMLTCLFCYIIWSCIYESRCPNFASICICNIHKPHFPHIYCPSIINSRHFIYLYYVIFLTGISQEHFTLHYLSIIYLPVRLYSTLYFIPG